MKRSIVLVLMIVAVWSRAGTDVAYLHWSDSANFLAWMRDCGLATCGSWQLDGRGTDTGLKPAALRRVEALKIARDPYLDKCGALWSLAHPGTDCDFPKGTNL